MDYAAECQRATSSFFDGRVILMPGLSEYILGKQTGYMKIAPKC